MFENRTEYGVYRMHVDPYLIYKNHILIFQKRVFMYLFSNA